MSKSTVGLEVRQILWSRRNLLKTGAGLLAGLSGLGAVSAFAGAGPYKVIVVGGGFGGATAAKYLKLWGKESVDVVLIEPDAVYNSPILSGLVVTQQLEIDRLDFGFERLRDVHGVNVVQDRVSAVDSESKTVTLSNGVTKLYYDRLIMSPGIDYVDVPGWDRSKIPHAWSGRDQLELLQTQLANFPQGGTLVIKVPVGPYRCPPGPYERASTMADFLRVNGKNARVIVLDAQPAIAVEPGTFGPLYEEFKVKYHGSIKVQSVNSGDDQGQGKSITFVEQYRDTSGTLTGETSEPETIEADVINLIGDHKAASILFAAGLVPEGMLWAPINPLTYESTVAGKQFIHVLGDAQSTAQVKAGQSANNQAKVCVDAILRTLSGGEPYGSPIVTVGCASLVTQTKVNWAANTWRYNPHHLLIYRDIAAFSPEPNAENWEPMLQWAHNLFADTWG